MHSDYYTLDNGKQIVDYIYEYNLGFSYGNAAKYLVRCGRKENNSAESDLNKALVYITSARGEYGFFRRMLMRTVNSFLFNSKLQLAEHHLAEIIKAIITFDSPKKIARLIVNYANWRGIKIKPEFEKYGK